MFYLRQKHWCKNILIELSYVDFHVVREAITARELPLAEFALIRFGTCVRPVVSPQILRPGKLPAASVPCALNMASPPCASSSAPSGLRSL